MLRKIVALTPFCGAILLPIAIPLTIVKAGLGPGILIALLLSILWFVAMLRTAEMPH